MLILFYILTLVYASSVIESHNKLKFTNKADPTQDITLDQGLYDNLRLITTERFKRNIEIKGGDISNNGSIYKHTDLNNPANGTLLLCFLNGTLNTTQDLLNFDQECKQ